MNPQALVLVFGFLLMGVFLPGAAAEQPFRLPALPDHLPQVMWGSTCQAPDGTVLAFGGEDQHAADGRYHTHLKVGGAEGPAVELTERLRAGNPLQALHDRIDKVGDGTKQALARIRFAYLDGRARAAPDAGAGTPAQALSRQLALANAALADCSRPQPLLTPDHQRQLDLASGRLAAAVRMMTSVLAGLPGAVAVDTVSTLDQARTELEQAAALLDAEPGPRALSPLVYDERSRLFILVGGDHLDYLTNDTWTFDPAALVWRQRHPRGAPAPRADHRLVAAAGRITLSGGYTYSNTTDYMGGPFVHLGDGDWVYDLAADTWSPSGAGQPVADGGRTYRRGPFHPDFFLQGARPDADAVAARLRDLPANTWMAMDPPQLPQMQRDWGTAVIDPDHDVLLRWSGGHCAHGGSDVVMYHFTTNRWELPFPVELPLGQCYVNTAYPGGVDFNLRPWVTGHTYKSYAYDAVSRRMVFVGQQALSHRFDPASGDWDGSAAKPDGMTYDGAFYTLLCKQIPQGIACWTRDGRIFTYAGAADGSGQWRPRAIADAELPGSEVDSAGIDYDSRRDRLLLFPGRYGMPYTGDIVAIAMATATVQRLRPAGMAGAARMPAFLRETCYVASRDLVLTGVTLAPDADGVRWTPAYDCAANAWIACRIAGPNPAGKEGRDVSLGLTYDARRDALWAVDTRGQVFVLRLDAATLVRKDL